MTEPPSLSRRCDQCAHVEMLRGVHPMRCTSPVLSQSLPVGIVRDDRGACGPMAILWEQRGVQWGKQ